MQIGLNSTSPSFAQSNHTASIFHISGLHNKTSFDIIHYSVDVPSKPFLKLTPMSFLDQKLLVNQAYELLNVMTSLGSLALT